MSRTIATNGTVGIHLTNPSDNPVTVTAGGTINSGGNYAIYGSAAAAWSLTNSGNLSGVQYGVTLAGSGTITNHGSIAATGTKSIAVVLQAGGRIVNGAANVPAARISGSYYGVEIAGAAGAIVNFGTIASGDQPGSGDVVLKQGGTVINGATNATAASISGGAASAVYIIGGTSALVVNHGTIAGLGAGAGGVDLWSGGKVLNGAPGNTGATITGPNVGVYVTGGVGTVVNDGVIAGGPGASWGVYMRAGGSVINAVAAAQIRGAYRTVDIRGGAGTVVNNGTIAGLPGDSWGVYLAAGGTIVNATTASAITAGGFAIWVQAGPGTVVNQGTIKGSTAGVVSSGVLLNHGGSVRNGAPGNTAATINGYVNTVLIGNGTGTVVNDGTITSEQYAAVALAGGGAVTNGVATAVLVGNQFGAFVNGGAGTLVNAGTISGQGSGVALVQGGLVSNTATGRIVGAGLYGIIISNGSGTVSNSGLVRGPLGVFMPDSGVVSNAGTIIGTGGSAVVGGAGNDRVVVWPGAVFGGVVTVGAGANVLQLAAGATAGALSGLGTRFVGFGTVQVNAGAHWTLAGGNTLTSGAALNMAAGATITVAGSLVAQGAIAFGGAGSHTLAVAAGGRIEVGTAGGAAAGKITVDAGKTLLGHGTLRAPVVDNGGLRAIGGTLEVNGGITGAGTVSIGANAAVSDNGVLTANKVVFLAGGGETLRLAEPATAAGTINVPSLMSGFVHTDTIDLLGLTSATLKSFSGGVLAIGGTWHGNAATFDLHFAGSLSLASFAAANDPSGVVITHT